MCDGYRIAIMQPYFLPYLGYWQLMNCVEKFVAYDDVQFTKKGWIHRNRHLNNGKDQVFTLPLKKDSDYLDVVDRSVSDSWEVEKDKLKRKIEGAYKKAPYFRQVMPVFEACIDYQGSNLFDFVFNSIRIVKETLGISTELLVSSEISDSKHLKSQERVLEICRAIEATEYVNPIGGYELYDKRDFEEKGVNLWFHKVGNVTYDQMQNEFFPNLSILDALMFIGVEGVQGELENFELVQ